MPYLGHVRHGARLLPCARAYSVVAWGRNLEGQCGVGSSRLVVTEPEEVQGFPHSSSGGGSVLSLSAAKTHSAVVLDNGEVWTWGDGTAAKLGHGTTEGCARPHRVETLVGRARVKAAALGRNHTMFLDDAGSVWTAGEARVGQASLGLESFATRQALAVPGIQHGGPIAEQGWVGEPAGAAARAAQPISGGGWSSGSSSSSSSSSSPPSGAGVWVDRQRKGSNLSAALAAAQQQSAYSAHLVPFVDHSGRATELAAAQGLYDAAFEAWLSPRSTATRYESDSPLGITTAGYPLGQTGHPFRLPADSFFDGQRIVDVAASRHRTWVVTADGRVWALGGDWGRPDKATALEAALARGWLAPAVPLAADIARAVAAEGGARKVVAGGGFAALLTASGEVVVWGAQDVIAGGGTSFSSGPEPEAWQTPGVQALLPHARTWKSPHEAGVVIIPRGLPSMVDIAAGWSHLALTDGRKVWTLGRPVGAMRSSISTVPLADDWLEPRESIDLGPDTGIDTLAAGGGATAAIADDGSLTMLGVLLTQAGAEALAHAARQGDARMPLAEATWGPGFAGMGSPGEPVRVSGLGKVRAIALGPQHALAELED